MTSEAPAPRALHLDLLRRVEETWQRMSRHKLRAALTARRKPGYG